MTPTRRILAFLLCALALSALPLADSAASAPFGLSPYTAEYQLLRNGKVAGRATIRLSREPGRPGLWRLHSHSEGTDGLAALTGLRVTETSIFRADAQGLACVEYHYQQGGLRKRERSVHCDDNGIVSRDHKGQYRFPARSGVLDRQSVSLALASDLHAGRRDGLAYAVVDREQLQTQHYQVHGEEVTEVPAGRLAALRIERLRQNQARTTTTWHGLQQNLIPVRIMQHEDGEGDYELRLVSFKKGEA